MLIAPDYWTARDRFRAAARKLGWTLTAFPIESSDASDPALTIDAAVSPGDPAAPLLFVSSGVHGVEGFFGSAVQVSAIEAWAQTGGPAGVRCVFVHSVCPFGFAHIRRMDEANIDLNRNFLLGSQEFRGCPPTYAVLDPVLNPQRPPGRWESFTLRAVKAIVFQGLASLKQAIAGGQYEFPRGMFYGGRGPARAHAILADQFPGWLADSPRGAILDFHSGLGRWGRYRLLMEAPHTPEQIALATCWFGRGLLENCRPEGTAYASRGGFDLWCHTQTAGRDFVSFCAEVGTYWVVRVLGAIRAENMAHHWAQPGDAATVRAKADLHEMFCPRSALWRQRAIGGGVELIQNAARGLAVGM